MNNFIKKYLRPLLKSLGIYSACYISFFRAQKFYYDFENKFKKKFLKTAVILTYHRIDKVLGDPRLLCVTPICFENHLIFLKENYEVISLPELITRLEEKRLIGTEAVITLDDGYRDNLINALPLLEKHQLPATIFVTTGFLGQRANLAWDKEYSESDRAWFLNSDEVKQLSENPLITIGAHTHTHPRLSELNDDNQTNEIDESKKILEDITGKPVIVFAYPFGRQIDITSSSPKIVEKCGFKGACLTKERLITDNSTSYALPRVNIREYSLDELKTKLFI